MYDQGYQDAGYGYAPGYSETAGTYYGANGTEEDGGESFVTTMIDTAKSYATMVAGNWMIPAGIGALAGAWSYFGAEADVVDALSHGVIAAGIAHAGAVLIAEGFDAFSSTSFWYGGGIIAAGAVLPMVADFVEEKTGFGFANSGMGYL
jgi:hypothetical protein